MLLEQKAAFRNLSWKRKKSKFLLFGRWLLETKSLRSSQLSRSDNKNDYNDQDDNKTYNNNNKNYYEENYND